jgi:hypothetical protein
MCNSFAYSSGLVYCTPSVVSTLQTYGSHAADAINNPLQLSTCYKISIGALGSPGDGVYYSAKTKRFKRASYLLQKRTVCLASSTGNGKVCYTSKQGRCVKLQVDVWPNYMSQIANSHISAAYQAFNTGKYAGCDAIELEAMRFQVGGN